MIVQRDFTKLANENETSGGDRRVQCGRRPHRSFGLFSGGPFAIFGVPFRAGNLFVIVW